jgi:methylase of polypeptide subunit release factors
MKSFKFGEYAMDLAPLREVHLPSYVGQNIAHRFVKHFTESRAAASRLRGVRRAVEIGPGAGHLSVLIAMMCPNLEELVIVDVYVDCLEATEQNFKRNGMDLRKLTKVESDVVDFFKREEANGQSYDLIICNPPCVPAEAVTNHASLSGSTVAFFTSSNYGRYVLDGVIEGAAAVLSPTGIMLTSDNSLCDMDKTDAKIMKLFDGEKSQFTVLDTMHLDVPALDPEYGLWVSDKDFSMWMRTGKVQVKDTVPEKSAVGLAKDEFGEKALKLGEQLRDAKKFEAFFHFRRVLLVEKGKSTPSKL